MRKKMSEINGLIFTGGDIDLYVNGSMADYTKVVKFVVEETKRINDKGEIFPLWGICQGHEALNVVVAGNYSAITKSIAPLKTISLLAETNQGCLAS